MIAERHNTPKCVLSRGDRLEEMIQGSNISDVAFYGATIVDVIFHEPFAAACRRVARFSGRVLHNAESLYDGAHQRIEAIGKIALQNKETPLAPSPTEHTL